MTDICCCLCVCVFSYSQLLFVPHGFDKSVPSDYFQLVRVALAGKRAIRKTTGKRYQVGQASRLLYAASGISDDWAKVEAGVKFTHTFELRDTGEHGFLVPPDQIEDTCSEIVAAVTAMITKSDTYL